MINFFSSINLLLSVPSWRENHIEPLDDDDDDDSLNPPEVRHVWMKNADDSTSGGWKWHQIMSEIIYVWNFLPFKPLDDSVFLKRHSKLELDEKRRKRYQTELFNLLFKCFSSENSSPTNIYLLKLTIRCDNKDVHRVEHFEVVKYNTTKYIKKNLTKIKKKTVHKALLYCNRH